MATLSDRKLGQSPDGDTLINYYHADLLSAQDYYPGGMILPRRFYSSDSYRFGFNGKENDNEIKGTGNQQDYGFRIYDPRIVRFNSVDPIAKKYPELTPYQFASNSPIWAIDLDGLEAWIATNQWSKSDINGFARYATAKIKEYKADKIEDDCANFALRLIVDYAHDNSLPLILTNSSGQSFDASSTEYSNYDQYLDAVRGGVQAADLPLNTYGVRQSDTHAGDMEIIQYDKHRGKRVDFQHVVIFEKVNSKNVNESDVVWGNSPPAELTGMNINWPRRKADPAKEKWSIMSGNLNSRWSVLNPSNMPAEDPIQKMTPIQNPQISTDNANSGTIQTR